MTVFDLETFQDTDDPTYIAWKMGNLSAPSTYKDPEKIEQYIAKEKVAFYDKLALNPLTGKIILAGFLTDVLPPFIKEGQDDNIRCVKYDIDSKPVYAISIGLDPQTTEKTIIQAVWAIIAYTRLQDGEVFITFNGKAFDIPFLIKRTMITGHYVPMRGLMTKFLSKYNNDPHLDLYTFLGDGSLVEWAYRLGISDSLVRDGYKIGEWYKMGRLDLIRDKNLQDLAQSRAIAKKVVDLI